MSRTSGKEMAMTKAKDRLNELPECLLLDEILPKISFRDAIRCSQISQRWRFLWKKMPHLNFCCQDFKNLKDYNIPAIITDALLQHSASLYSFQLQIALNPWTKDWVRFWIHLAALKRVKRFTLEIVDRNARAGKKVENLADSVFECESLTALKVKYCVLPKIPNSFGGFQYLKTCYWYNVPGLNDTVFPQLLELCPNLEKLGVHVCLDLRNIKINAPSLRYLDVGYLMPSTTLEVICPLLTEIKLEQCHAAHGLQLLKGVSGTESVKKITLLNYGGINKEIPGFAVLDRFPHLQELTIHGRCFQEMISVNKAPEGVTLLNLKKVHAHIGPEMDEREVTLLSFLLRTCPLNDMRVFLPPSCSKTVQNKLQDLKNEFPERKIHIGKIRWIDRYGEVCQICDTSPEKCNRFVNFGGKV